MPLPEHRTASIAFLQFTGLDRIVADGGAGATASRLDELVRLVQDACERYEVCFLDSDIAADGGKIRLSAGAPRVVGDDEERMLLALRQIVDADLPLPVQVGVNRGPVFTGEVGPGYRRWYAVMGDTVNLAARVMGKAPAGHLYATREVLAPHARAVPPERGRAVHGQGQDPARAGLGRRVRRCGRPRIKRSVPSCRWSGVDAGARAARGRRSRTPGAAREALIELVGETGSGKSRLLAEARKLGDGMRVLRTTCEVVTQETPYFPWRELLRQLLGAGWDDPEDRVRERLEAEIRAGQPDLMPWLPLIAIVVDVPVPSTTEVDELAAEARASKLREVVLRFLGRALVVPTIVEVEHAHLMDAASAALFEALAGELESSSWLVLAHSSGRARWAVGVSSATRIELGPLARDDALTLAQATPEAAQVPPHVLELAVERSGGSPEFLLDLLAAAAAGDRDELPESVGRRDDGADRRARPA